VHAYATRVEKLFSAPFVPVGRAIVSTEQLPSDLLLKQG